MIYIIIGLIGAIVMFCGDMTLYYTPDDFDYESGKNQNVMQAVVDVMKKLPARRVAIGGMIGPVAAFLYCIGRFFSDDTFLPEGGFLSETEEKIYIALVNRIGNNIDVAKEASAAKDSAEQVASGDKPDIPMLLFLSEKKLDGSNELWKKVACDYAEGLDAVQFVELDCGHYVHHFEYERISKDMKEFIEGLGK